MANCQVAWCWAPAAMGRTSPSPHVRAGHPLVRVKTDTVRWTMENACFASFLSGFCQEFKHVQNQECLSRLLALQVTPKPPHLFTAGASSRSTGSDRVEHRLTEALRPYRSGPRRIASTSPRTPRAHRSSWPIWIGPCPQRQVAQSQG